MTGHTTLARLPGPGRLRLLLVFLLVLTGLVLVGFMIAAVSRFVIPPRTFTEIGPVADYPPSDQPYAIQIQGWLFYVVNTGKELVAQYPIHKLSPFCRIRWINQGNYFTDGCRGTKFQVDGTYLSGPPATMQRYPLVVEDGVVRVDLTRTMPGPELVVGNDSY